MELNQKKSKVSAEELILDPNPKITIKHDLYDFSEILELIKDYLEKIESPHPIGIYGGWGSGKTTLKNFIIESIENDPNTTIFPIDFNAWENEQQAGLLIPLLNKLFKTAGFKGEKAKKIFSVLTMSFSDIFLKLATVKLLSVKDFINFEKYVDENFLKYSEYFDKLGKARNDFKDLINQIIKNKKKGKVAIFVDELDRCNPDNAIRLLESIKNFFNVKGCVFIILVDDEILASYINKKYENTAMNGHLYLEKIVNTKFRIPKISLEKITKLFNQFAIIKPDFFTISPKMYNPRKIGRIYEKVKLLIEREKEKHINQDKLAKSIPGQPLNKIEIYYRIFLIIFLHECYPHIYLIIDRCKPDYWEDVKHKIKEVQTKAGASAYGDIRSYIDLEHDEILLS